ncbi:Phage infection protein [Streptococcus infantarius subsp. infantarius]|uniref:YhgE/Pip domain-containing protein n=1 Tax=Streptococcus infantarius TaxID=102684 RepID=UPI001BD96D6A|nr:YhgE/Pip domain-containing protein [Streptococcus infantarius]MBT0903639.1 YhgE/Pip domain-containing protein [Streptococcus infantarius subsp. infantarius]MBT0917552.1 YhgE/Pip domain-containing protein [Streptococcus infantarius subsp. infantarius]MBT0931068.1 YhgE/Pip domain-containing protein [Streptococcus infantarius subsp. infantarius]MCO4576993.1 Phage infection protein [Streptococcus infantarius subsp. infantarius]MCO4596607.1 Phage infection protein [Streptococcus infantarius subs
MLEELKALIKSPKLWVTMIGVALVPALYNLSFLGSMWDPYGNVKNLPVAVVNEDKSATLNDKTLTIGDDMVDSMSKNKALDYHFVSQKKADKGLKDGDYYMVITLPEDLSEKASSLLTDNPKKLNIKYQTTAGRSFVASKMSESAMTKLKDTVSENITETYTKAVFKSMSSLQDGLQEASDGSNELLSGSQQLESGSQTITDNLNTAASGSQTLADGTATLSSGLTTYTNGVSTLASGANELNSNSMALISGIAQLKESSTQVQRLVDGANSLTDGLQQLATSTTLSAEESANIQSLISGLPQLNAGIQQLNASVSEISTNVGITQISTVLSDIASQAQGILEAEEKDSSDRLAAIQATAAYQSLDASQQAELVNALNTSGNSVSQQAQQILTDVQTMKASLTALSPLSSKVTELQAGVSQIASQSNIALPGSVAALTKLSAGLTKVNTVTTTQLVPGSSQIASGVSTLNTKLSSGANELLTGATTYTNAVSQIASGANQLVANNTQLTSGASQLQSGAEALASGSSQLAAGSGTLTSGLTTLTSGLSTLSSSLTDASKQLSLVSVTSKNAKLVSNPVSTKETDNDNVKVNGIGMAPYMIAVSLMVVALSTNVIFASSLSGRPVKNRFEWAKQKLFINGLISTVGSLVLYGAIQFLGFEANYEWRTIFLIILGGWTLMALVTALVGWDNRYGSFLSLIMLLLQVGSAGGSYPIELSPKFFQVVHPYMPMTYIVTGLRQTISMTGSIGTQVSVLSAFLVAFMVLGLIIYRQPKTEN